MARCMLQAKAHGEAQAVKDVELMCQVMELQQRLADRLQVQASSMEVYILPAGLGDYRNLSLKSSATVTVSAGLMVHFTLHGGGVGVEGGEY